MKASGKFKVSTMFYIVLIGVSLGILSQTKFPIMRILLYVFGAIAVALGAFLLAGLVTAYMRRDMALKDLNLCEVQKAKKVNEEKIKGLRKKAENMDLQSKQGRKLIKKLQTRVNNLAVCYFTEGEVQRAIDTLEKMDPDPEFHDVFLVCHHNLAYYYIEMGNVEQFLAEWEKLDEYLNKLPKDIAGKYPGIFAHLQSRLDVHNGNYSEALEFYLESIENEKGQPVTLLSQVNTRYELACIYEALGDVEKQKEYLAFAAEKGKDSDMARKAREKLSEL